MQRGEQLSQFRASAIKEKEGVRLVADRVVNKLLNVSDCLLCGSAWVTHTVVMR